MWPTAPRCRDCTLDVAISASWALIHGGVSNWIALNSLSIGSAMRAAGNGVLPNAVHATFLQQQRSLHDVGLLSRVVQPHTADGSARTRLQRSADGTCQLARIAETMD